MTLEKIFHFIFFMFFFLVKSTSDIFHWWLLFTTGCERSAQSAIVPLSSAAGLSEHPSSGGSVCSQRSRSSEEPKLSRSSEEPKL